MPRFAANISTMYAEHDFLQRFGYAAADGFAAVECQFPYEWSAREVAQRLRDAGLRMVLLNAPPGTAVDGSVARAWAQGARGTACLPGQRAQFRADVLRALDYAAQLDCPRIHVMAGVVGGAPEDAGEWDRLHDTYVDNVQWAAQQAGRAGRCVLIEALNPHDAPGYFLRTQAQAHAVVQAVGSAALKVQMDLYHCQRTEGDVLHRLRQYLPTGRVGHIQIAGVPDRHEPDATSELNLALLLAEIDRLLLPGDQPTLWVGCEYRPRAGTSAGLGWLRALGGLPPIAQQRDAITASDNQ